MRETSAKVIRVITLPPVTAFFLILLLRGLFPAGHDRIAVALLCGLPLLTYLFWRIVPSQHEQGRKSQRKLAILLSVAGYALGLTFCDVFSVLPQRFSCICF